MISLQYNITMSTVVAAFSIDTREMGLSSTEQTPSDFNFVLKNSFNLDHSKEYDIALARGLIFYAWDNFIAGLVPFDFEFDGNQYSLETGNYSLLTLEAKIKEKITIGGGNPDDFEMRKDYPTGFIVITLLNGATFTPESEGLARMIGFVQNSQLTGITYGTDLPDFEGENRRIFILNSIVLANNTYVNDKMDNYLYEIKPPERPAYSQYNVVDTPESFIWMPTNTKNIFNMTIKIVNQDGKTVNLNGTNIKLWMVMRERPHSTVRVEGMNSGDRLPRY